MCCLILVLPIRGAARQDPKAHGAGSTAGPSWPGKITMEETQPKDEVPDIPDQQGTSTAATGPAGAHFEEPAFYLLAMLSGAPPRGLPGTTIERIALQQANNGRPLDDVIVHAIDGSGRPAVLEIQVKRTITFTPTDPIFRKVVGQIAQAVRLPGFWSKQYGLAIATARGSRKIDGPYQDLLALARQIGMRKRHSPHN